jgi:hypothetical protein
MDGPPSVRRHCHQLRLGELHVSDGFWGDSVQELSQVADGWNLTPLYELCPKGNDCKNGSWPLVPLSWDAKGNLYGATYEV